MPFDYFSSHKYVLQHCLGNLISVLLASPSSLCCPFWVFKQPVFSQATKTIGAGSFEIPLQWLLLVLNQSSEDNRRWKKQCKTRTFYRNSVILRASCKDVLSNLSWKFSIKLASCNNIEHKIWNNIFPFFVIISSQSVIQSRVTKESYPSSFCSRSCKQKTNPSHFTSRFLLSFANSYSRREQF